MGIFAGAFLSGALAGRLKIKTEHSPRITPRPRLVMASLGGLLFGLGSQFGRGCTSGAALSGSASLFVVMGLAAFFVVSLIEARARKIEY